MTPANITDDVYTIFASEGVNRGTNGFTTCVLDVALGNVDLCVGSFWETAPRRDRVLFTSPLDINVFRLVTVAELATGFSVGNLIDIFAPFSWTVWWCVFGMFVFTGLCMWVVNHDPTEDFPEENLFPHPMGIVKGVWVSAMGYLAGNQFVVDRWSTRLIVLGFSFFLYISGASYTANLASFMVLKAGASTGIGSFADIVSQNKKVCIPPEIQGMVTASTPGIDTQLVVKNSVDVLLDNMHRGECAAAVIGKLEFAKFVTAESASYTICTTEGDFNYLGGYFCGGADSTLQLVELSKCICGHSETLADTETCPSDCHAPSTKFCDVVAVPDETFDGSLNFAFPVMAWIEPYVSAWIVKMKQEGQIGESYSTQFQSKNPDKCPATSPQGQGASSTTDTGATALGIQSMAGTFVFSGIIMFAGMGLHLVQTLQERKEAKRNGVLDAKIQDANGDSAVAVGGPNVAWGENGGGLVDGTASNGTADMAQKMPQDVGAKVDAMGAKIDELQRQMSRLATMMEASQAGRGDLPTSVLS
mmetsp:Transcript_42883/g.107329  ORF Transcript_42883/g.107329 Transcript_42883/m.107329 type:complete len:532 (+) Transcript_42883:524-2119(+)